MSVLKSALKPLLDKYQLPFKTAMLHAIIQFQEPPKPQLLCWLRNQPQVSSWV